jgi:hypothetical protein
MFEPSQFQGLSDEDPAALRRRIDRNITRARDARAFAIYAFVRQTVSAAIGRARRPVVSCGPRNDALGHADVAASAPKLNRKHVLCDIEADPGTLMPASLPQQRRLTQKCVTVAHVGAYDGGEPAAEGYRKGAQTLMPSRAGRSQARGAPRAAGRISWWRRTAIGRQSDANRTAIGQIPDDNSGYLRSYPSNGRPRTSRTPRRSAHLLPRS